jgi:hypothetical protein
MERKGQEIGAPCPSIAEWYSNSGRAGSLPTALSRTTRGGKCPSCSAVTSSPCKSEGSDGQGYSDNPGQCPRLEKRSDLLLSQAAENHQGRGRDLSLVAEFPDREPVVLTGILVYIPVPRIGFTRDQEFSSAVNLQDK